MSHVKVIDSQFKTTSIKVTPETRLYEVRSAAVAKLRPGKKEEDYGFELDGLVGKGKKVDLTISFQRSGLTPGAKLLLVEVSRSPSVVQIKLELPNGIDNRNIPPMSVSNDTTLWGLLRRFEDTSDKKLSFTQRGTPQVENGPTASGAGRLYYDMPSVSTGGKSTTTFVELQKTLAQLGIVDGRHIIRLSFVPTKQPLEEAIMDAKNYFQDESDQAAEPVLEKPKPETLPDAVAELSSSKEPVSRDTLMKDAPAVQEAETVVNELPQPETMAQDLSQQVTASAGSNSRLVGVYAAPTNATPQAATLPHNEKDFEPTIFHAKLAQNRLQEGTQNKKLLGYEEEERAAEEKKATLSSHKSVKVQVRYPSQARSEFVFTDEDSAATLYQHVTEMLIDEDQPFKLLEVGKLVTNDASKLLIRHLGFKGRVLLNFAWEESASQTARSRRSVLKSEHEQAAIALPVPKTAAAEPEEDIKSTGNSLGSKPAGSSDKKGKGVSSFLRGLSKK